MKLNALIPCIVTPALAATALAAAPEIAPFITGKAVYDQHCAACHGVTGDGNGPAAVWLYPKPRKFSDGLFKIQSTPAGALPTEEDLLRTITRGMPGSSMPAFNYLSEAERREAMLYVKHLTAYTNGSGQRINRFEEARQRGLPTAAVPVPPEPAATLQALTLGKEMYFKMQCNNCHGEAGAGDGPLVPTLKDHWGLPIRPRDFNTGAFRGGHTGRDLYLRIHNGLAGTPMVPYADDALSPDQRWALVHFVQSLRRTDVAVNDILAPADTILRVRQVKKLPVEPKDPFWDSADPVRVPLNPLWPEPYPLSALAVVAVHDGKRIAFLCQWRDSLPNGAPVRVQDFQDALALQFSLKGTMPFLGMGDAENPVNLWQWKAGWQAEAEGRRQDVTEVYASMHVDTYFATSYRTATDAGNLLAQPHQTAVEDANARGFGSFKSQPLSQQNVQGRGVWHDGFWNVVLVRQLKSRERDDIQFTAQKPIPVAFAVWNGEQHDRNGQKVISNWFQLVLE
jgi:DMSO reductase family type II enzyme heme b subunit